jgi:hypothetical protein
MLKSSWKTEVENKTRAQCPLPSAYVGYSTVVKNNFEAGSVYSYNIYKIVE